MRHASHTHIEGAHVVCEMKEICSRFQEVKLLHIGREANKAAHCCSKEALSIVESVYFDVMPGLLTDIIQSECNHYPV
jgi:hypothetical protein